VPSLVCFLNKVDVVDDEELLELVEMELRGEPLSPPLARPCTAPGLAGRWHPPAAAARRGLGEPPWTPCPAFVFLVAC
jgi:hypothetical protein